MYTWSLVWFWFRFEYIVDIDTYKDFYLSIIPSINYIRSSKDGIGCRKHQLAFNWLNMSFNAYYYYPSNFFFDNNGDFIGNRIYPSLRIETIVYDK